MNSGAGKTSGSGPTTVPPSTTSFPAAQTQQWIVQFGSGAGDTYAGLTTDAQGNAIVAGTTPGAFPGYSNPTHTQELFLAKFDPMGHTVWIKQYNPAQAGVLFEAFTSDRQGNLYLGGFSASPTAVSSSVTKLDSNGNVVWTHNFQVGGGSSNAWTLAMDGQGNVLVAGETMMGSNSSPGAYIAKLDGLTGKQMWLADYSKGSLYILSLAADSAGDAYAVGFSTNSFPGSNTGNNCVITSTGSGTTAGTADCSPPFLVKLDANTGQQVWLQQQQSLASFNLAYLSNMAVDGNGNVYVSGEIGASGTATTPAPQLLVARFDPSSGDEIWQQNIFPEPATSGPPPILQDGLGLTIDSVGNPIISGLTSVSLLAGSFQTPPQDVFVAKLNASGQGTWVQQFGTGAETATIGDFPQNSVAADSQNDVFVSGMTNGAFPGFSNPSNTGEIFLAKFAPQ
ncbi:MAG: outer membrane protein assembly factor BamB family protein [Burkholderiales bacterium]